jgi:hypothetical protein
MERSTLSANISYNAAQAEALRWLNTSRSTEENESSEGLDRFLSGSFKEIAGPKSILSSEYRQRYLLSFAEQNQNLNSIYGIDLLSNR